MSTKEQEKMDRNMREWQIQEGKEGHLKVVAVDGRSHKRGSKQIKSESAPLRVTIEDLSVF